MLCFCTAQYLQRAAHVAAAAAYGRLELAPFRVMTLPTG